MTDFVNQRNVVKITSNSIVDTIFNIFSTKTTNRPLTDFQTVIMEYFLDESSRKFTIPATITNAVNGEITVRPNQFTKWPRFEPTQTRRTGTGQFIFNDGTSTQFNTPPFPLEVLRS